MTPQNCNLPNLLIAGVHKAGTTSLYSYLAKHPDICPSFRKETGFFTPLMFNRPIEPLQTYAGYFSHCNAESYRLEASPSYFYGKEAVINAIRQHLGSIRIIVVLRDPAERLLSFFSRAVSKSALPADMTFAEYLDQAERSESSTEHTVISRGIREGRYIEYIKPWQEAFGDNLRILFFEDMEKSAFDFTVGICRWLGIDSACYSAADFTVENRTVQYRARGLHKRVMTLYMQNEAFWRKNAALKRRLRSIYNFFNADAGKNLKVIDAAANERLRSIYQPSNRELESFLRSHNYASLPSWLTA